MSEGNKKMHELELQFKMHESQCEERWKTIFTRMEGVETSLNKMNQLLLGGGATTVLFLLGILSTLLVNHW
tara:strand:+ start:2254 stop:2466 length:213 start_codon:yes stop_codon:yes gene_type:complete